MPCLNAIKLVNGFRVILRHRLAGAVYSLTAAQYVAAVLNFVTNVLIARWLGPTEYGRVALVIAYPTLLWSFVGVKTVSVITRYVSVFRAQGKDRELAATVKASYLLDLGASLVAVGLIAITASGVSNVVYRQADLNWMMLVYAVSFPFFALAGGSLAVLSAWEKFQWLAGFEILQPVLKLLLVSLFLFLGFGARGTVMGMAIAQASVGLFMATAASWLLVREGKGLWWKASLQGLKHIRAELAKLFGWNYLLVTFSGLVGQVPVMLLGRFRGPEEAGFYRLATSITTVGSYVEASLGRVVYPVLSARYSIETMESLRRSLRSWTLKGGLPAAALLLLAIPLLPVLIVWFFGPEYRPMVSGAQVLLAGGAVSALFFWLSSFYYASGKVAAYVKSYGIYTLSVIGLGWFIIKISGFWGLAWLVSVSKIIFVFTIVITTVIWLKRG